VSNMSPSKLLKDEKKDGSKLFPVQVLPIQGSNTAKALNQGKPKKKKGMLLGAEEKISPDNFALPAPSFTISMDQVKKKEPEESNWKTTTLIDYNKLEAVTKRNKKLKNVNRRSRVYSWQFIKGVMQNNGLSNIPEPVMEEKQNQARPAVNLIIKLLAENNTGDSMQAVNSIEKLLAQEKLLGTPWREIADETTVELILEGVNALQFIIALIKAYDIPPSDVGLFLATPHDEGTMSLIEEAVCQDSLDLFLEVLKMDDNLLKGVLECKDTTEFVEKEISDLLNDMGNTEE